MRRRFWLLAVVAFILAAGAAGHLLRPATSPQADKHRPSIAIAYYQDPDGKPSYSLHPRKTTDGRNYRPVPVSEEKSFNPAAEASLQQGAQRILYYRNPMGLPDVSSSPKKDSMGMDYIPVYEGEDNDPSIRIPQGRLQRSGVISEAALLQPIRSSLVAPGVVQLDERRVAVISLRTESWIQRIEDVTTGSRVRKGQPLLQLYSPAIASAAAEFATIAGFPENQKGNGLVGARQRLLNLGTPESVIEYIRRTGEAPVSIAWTVPRDGIILERNATEGMRAEPGAPLFRIADTSVVWIILDLPEGAIGKVAAGQKAYATAKGYPGKSFEGVVKTIYPQVSKETRTVKVRVEVDNGDQLLLPDMYVEGEILGGSAEPVITVPESSIIDSGRRKLVFIDKGKGVLAPRDVVTGARGGGIVEILRGVEAGENVVTSANFLLDAESNLRAAVRGYAEGGAAK